MCNENNTLTTINHGRHGPLRLIEIKYRLSDQDISTNHLESFITKNLLMTLKKAGNITSCCTQLPVHFKGANSWYRKYDEFFFHENFMKKKFFK